MSPGRRHRGRAQTSRVGLPVASTSAVWPRACQSISPLLATAIPLGHLQLHRGMSNVESAAAAGDSYNLRSVLLADGTGAVVGSLPRLAVPARRLHRPPRLEGGGGRIGYSMASGVVIAMLCCSRPVRAARRAPADPGDRPDPALHRPADRRAGVPVRCPGRTPSPSSSRSSPTSPPGPGPDRRRAVGRRHHGGQGRRRQHGQRRRHLQGHDARSAAARSSPAWCSARSPRSSSTGSSCWAAGYSAVGAVLGFIGLVHGAKVGWDIGRRSPSATCSPAVILAGFVRCT